MNNLWGLLGPEARHQALYSGLLNLGGGLIAAGAPTTQPGMSARGLIAGTQGFNDAINDRQRTGLQGLLVGKQLEEAKRLSDQRALQAKFISTLPPEQQGIAQAAPEQFFGRYAANQIPDPSQVRKTLPPERVKALGFRDGDIVQEDGRGGYHVVRQSDVASPARHAQTLAERAAGRPSVAVSVKGEQKGSEAMFKNAAEGFNTAQNAAMDAQRKEGLYSSLESAFEGFRPGASAELRLKGLQVLRDLGVNVGDQAGAGELAQSVSRRLEILLAPRGQGQITESERIIIREQLPRLTQTPEGVKEVLGMMRRLDKYDVEVAKIYRENARKNSGVPNGLEIAEEVAKLPPPITAAELARLQGAPPAGSAAPPPAVAPAGGAPRVLRYDAQGNRIP